MEIQASQREKGQVLIIFVVGLLLVTAFVALAVDGGMFYSNRRVAQNGADAAALAGAGAAAEELDLQGIRSENFSCANAAMSNVTNAAVDAAIAQAAMNSFPIDDDISDGDGVEVLCGVEDKNGWDYPYLDVRTSINMQTETSLAHLFTDQMLLTRVEATTRVYPRTAMAFGYAIASLGTTCGGTEYGGTEYDGGGHGKIVVNGGSIFSNSCMNANGGVDVEVDPSEGHGIEYVTTYTKNGSSGSLTPSPTKAASHMPDTFQIPPPDCADLDSKGSGGAGTLEPGIYSEISLTGNSTMNLQPGLYCLDGDFTANNGTVTGNGVTLYFRSGVFSIGGNVKITLTAPTAKDPPAVKGLLIYLAKGNTGSIDLRGNSTSFYQGTVYAPDGIANVGGTSSTLASLRSQILAKEVRFHGTTVMTLEYEDDENYSVDPTLNLLR